MGQEAGSLSCNNHSAISKAVCLRNQNAECHSSHTKEKGGGGEVGILTVNSVMSSKSSCLDLLQRRKAGRHLLTAEWEGPAEQVAPLLPSHEEQGQVKKNCLGIPSIFP